MTFLSKRIAAIILFASIVALILISVPFPMAVTKPESVTYLTVVVRSTTLVTGMGQGVLTMEVIYSWTQMAVTTTHLTRTEVVSIAEAQGGRGFVVYVVFVLLNLMVVLLLVLRQRRRAAEKNQENLG